MRILNTKGDASLQDVILYLTITEALDLKVALDSLTDGSSTRGKHYHVDDDDYAHRITVCVYSADALDEFSQRSQIIIREDK